MTANPPPRPVTELFSESLQLSQKQWEVLDVLQTFPLGARTTELAEKLGMHVNTVRGHLDELISREAVRVSSVPAQGRGRPSYIFSVRVPDNRLVADEYVSLVEVMAEALAGQDTITPEALAQARRIGEAWAKKMGHAGEPIGDANAAIEKLFIKMRDMGFDPVITEPTTVALHACPFITESSLPSPFVCSIHEGFLREATGSVELTLLPFAGDGSCIVEIAEQDRT